ncbi:MAG: MopE-related protein [Myxococcota bacterium]|nr:MopE-related protein [Myxococcota bacterium]
MDWRRRGVLLVVIAACLSCSGSGTDNDTPNSAGANGSSTPNQPPTFAAGGGADGPDSGGTNRNRGAVEGAGGTGSAAARPLGQFQDPCTSNENCESSWCIPFEGRNICTITCITGDVCPADWGCRLVVNTPPDVVSVCRPPENRFCGPCETDDDCPGGPCRTLDGLKVCGLNCETDSDCPPASICQADGTVQSCVPITQSCTCSAERDGALRICQQANDIGQCIGRQVCDGETGWSLCDAQTPTRETCNLIDDDCNGLTDDVPGLGEVCEREAAVDGEVRICTGRLICSNDSTMPLCTAQAPTEEKCNFLDDDCDGDTDEGFDAVGEACEVGQGMCRRFGVNECSSNGERVVCSVPAGEPSPERCDLLDNDCDGRVDETFDTLGDRCTTGIGACFSAGTIVCDDARIATTCSATAGMPNDDVCNGVDDDCDGRTDETYPTVGEACLVGRGRCERRGLLRCSVNGQNTECSATPGEPEIERCNGLDDDCDGTTDEGFDNTGQACTIGDGVCRATGVTVCTADGLNVVCNAPVIEPDDERCNGLDDDCDGSADEGFDGLDEACVIGQGICRAAGVQQCSEDGLTTICRAEIIAPQLQDTCNGLDDDCDGTIDEDFPILNSPCTLGVGACRAAGIRVCSPNGRDTRCSALTKAPSEERCNGVDDDCDGAVDEDYPDLGTACAEGEGECLNRGVKVCGPDEDSVVCNVTAHDVVMNEGCNGRDDDCDGVIDEDFGNLGQACSVGVGRCFAQGVRVCSDDERATLCNAVAVQPTDEACNGADDDCDGRSDEAFPDLADVCVAGVGICRNVGVRICNADGDGTTCEANSGEPSDEVCNGLDDDCDGDTDESHPQLGEACGTGVGLCNRTGVFVCADVPSDAAVCNAVPGQPNAQENCDFQDDDCDGQSDEDYRNAQGVYNATNHCGACGNDCTTLWQPDPATFGVIPRCTIIADLAQCAFECEPGRLDLDGLPNNGCEFIPDPDAVYVTTPGNGGSDLGQCGNFERPCATVGRGLERVQQLARLRVLVAEGVYRESIRLVEGIELLGGHQRDTWIRNPDLFPTLLFGAGGGEGPHLYTVEIRNIVRETLLDGFVINGESPRGNGGNSYAIYVVDANGRLTLRNNRVFGGNGGRGSDGRSGTSGQPGSPGAQGNPGNSRSTPVGCLNQVLNPGGAGGQRQCGGFNVSGGVGGGAVCPQKNRREGSGLNGLGLGGGTGGLGGGGMEATQDFTACLVSDFIPVDANPGLDGAIGQDAVGALGAQDRDGIAGIHWLGLAGNDAPSGQRGSGGGGGGAAAGVDVNVPSVFGERVSDIGASGGGGGSGGCSGEGGQGGLAGGGSFGLYIAFSRANPNNFADLPTVVDNEVTRGLGGQGGRGGTGGGGGQGGVGGLGGDRSFSPLVVMDFCSLQGGEGGAGGRGGHGGGGGGGQGGISYDIYLVGGNGLQPTYVQDNLFTIEDAEPTGGPGGGGGNSSNTNIGLGGAAVSGQSGNIRLRP